MCILTLPCYSVAICSTVPFSCLQYDDTICLDPESNSKNTCDPWLKDTLLYLLLLLVTVVFLLLQELSGWTGSVACISSKSSTYLDKGLGALQEMLLALGLSALLVPVYNGLVGNTVLIIQNLENLGKRLDDTGVFITIHLYDVDKRDFGLGTVAEGLQDGGIFLRQESVNQDEGGYEGTERTPTSRRARPSIWSGRALQSTDAMSPCQMH